MFPSFRQLQDDAKLLSQLSVSAVRTSLNVSTSVKMPSSQVTPLLQFLLPVAAMCVFVSMTMIANLLANHFQSYEDIDWKFVVTFPEFSGHTEGSLRMLKRSDMSKVMSQHYFGNDF